ncbi:hypothetical protein HSBAA_52810 [Vreelandella sulfidaeris]|uniref:Lipoyl-binding domain-containing protein n=1 Tax=Vreelandella sulfidaeris TaxID=115553 RepID=A0A455UD61_9GAMM|nr:hypothetical protein HSBAA_52810 [Halomonas sulfidaeris]
MSSEIIKVPDIGGDTDVEIIEIAVSEGDVIEAEDTLITLESDKASMDVPAPKGGKVLKVLVKEGDSVSEGDDIVELKSKAAATVAMPNSQKKRQRKKISRKSSLKNGLKNSRRSRSPLPRNQPVESKRLILKCRTWAAQITLKLLKSP